MCSYFHRMTMQGCSKFLVPLGTTAVILQMSVKYPPGAERNEFHKTSAWYTWHVKKGVPPCLCLLESSSHLASNQDAAGGRPLPFSIRHSTGWMGHRVGSLASDPYFGSRPICHETNRIESSWRSEQNSHVCRRVHDQDMAKRRGEETGAVNVD